MRNLVFDIQRCSALALRIEDCAQELRRTRLNGRAQFKSDPLATSLPPSSQVCFGSLSRASSHCTIRWITCRRKRMP